MKKIWMMIGIVLALSSVVQADLVAPPGRKRAPAKYQKYPGTATILRVDKVSAAPEEYEVWFAFAPKGAIKDSRVKQALSAQKEYRWTLGSSGWNPGPKYLKKYGIVKGAKMPATFSCNFGGGGGNPFNMQLDGVDSSDYFEKLPDSKKPAS